MNPIVAFVKQTIQTGKAYGGEHFEHLSCLADPASEPHRSKPGEFSKNVSEKNRGETAFQRALCNAGKANVLCLSGAKEEITWKDIELPVVFSGKGRRPCIDLIGHSNLFGTFLCELKCYIKESGGAGNLPDYAILQSVLYYGIVANNHLELDKQEIYRMPPQFLWKDVVESKHVMILGNPNAWNKGLKKENSRRILALLSKIYCQLGITVIFCTLDDPFFSQNKIVKGRYAPEFQLAAEASCPLLKVVKFSS